MTRVGEPKAGGETLVYTPSSYIDRISVEKIFPQEQPVHVEIGAGDGSFLAAYAAAHPEINFLGLERLLGRLRKIEKKSHRAGLKNVRLMRLEASYFVQYLLPRDAIDAVHIYFPDPWPKRRHWKNRLINEAFTESVRAVLKKGGRIYLRTDNEDYFAQMTRVFDGNPKFKKVETPGELLGFITDFEREFHRRGVPTLHATYERVE